MLRTAEEIEQYKKEIVELDAEFQQFGDLNRESYAELARLKSSRQEAQGKADQEINQLLEGLPVGQTAGGTIDSVYKIKAQYENQHLDDSINKISTTCTKAKHKRDRAGKKRDGLKNEIHQNGINIHTVEVFKKYFKWIELYLATKDYFHNDLLPSVGQAYELDPQFPTRSDLLNLSKTAAVSLESHFREGSLHVIGMAETIENIANLGDAYGERLLDKEPSSPEIHTLENESFFGIESSDKPNLQDPENY